MKNEAIKVLQKKKKAILETWIKLQLVDETLREDLMSNDALREQSEELLNTISTRLTDENLDNLSTAGIEPVIDILNSISITRAKQGFSPRETGIYIFSLKDAILTTLQQEIKDPQELYEQSLKISKLIDSFG